MTVFRLLIVAVVVTLGVACTTTHTARPIGAGKGQVHLSVGGPVAGIGDPEIFVPLTVVTGKYGLTDRLDIYGGWHVIEPLLNNGNIFFDVGASYYVLDQDGFAPGLSIAGTASPLISPETFWALFDVNLTASWALDKSETNVLYTGFNNSITPFSNGVIDTPVYTWSPYVGYQLRVFDGLFGIDLETKWLRPYVDNKNSVVGYVSPLNLGALSFMVGISSTFGGAK